MAPPPPHPPVVLLQVFKQAFKQAEAAEECLVAGFGFNMGLKRTNPHKPMSKNHPSPKPYTTRIRIGFFGVVIVYFYNI